MVSSVINILILFLSKMKKNIKFKDISFIIVSYRSDSIINSCLNALPEESPKIIIENSYNKNLKLKLENNYSNLNCILSKKNLGYGAANNIGVKKSNTKYIFIINPDVIINKQSQEDILKIINEEDFDLAAPISSEYNNTHNFNNKSFLSVNEVKGFAMIMKKKYFENYLFDSNIFLYLEEIDLCRRIKNNNGKIILINTLVEHSGGNSHGNRDDLEMEKSRNWHWMWSQFYFHKKHDGYLSAFIRTLPNFVNCLFKLLFFKIFQKKEKYTKYKMRLLGLFNSYINNKSFYRPYQN